MKKLSIKFSALIITNLFIIIISSSNSMAYEAYYRNDSFTMASNASDPYFKIIQPILDKRCVVCHACREAECNLKLTSPEGMARGGSKKTSNGGVLLPVRRNKLFHDAKTTKEWRKKGFYSVMELPNYVKLFNLKSFKNDKRRNTTRAKSIFTAALLNKLDPKLENNKINYLGSNNQSCGDGRKDLRKVPGMPYNMAPLNYSDEFMPLYLWANEGEKAYIPSREIIREISTPNNPELISNWEQFFNENSHKSKWTSRFLYEHLFFAHFYFEEAPGEFFQMVRSSTKSPEEIDILPTKHAWERPSKKKFYYRLRKIHSTIVFKNHMVYKVNNSTLLELKLNFLQKDWGKKREHVKFSFKITNPLVAFKHIPAKTRYTWMLKNSHLLLDISARSQNCRSQGAAAPYWDNMLHLFVKPEVDATVVYDKKFYDKAGRYLPIPNLTNGQFNPFSDFKKAQNKYVKIKRKYQKKLLPNGFKINDLWKGSGSNKNSIVTVLRHKWTASAHQGQLGQMPRSVLLLDFATFERYFYLCNLATAVSDGLLWQSRVVTYLFDVKRESEDQFLSLIPKEYRRKIRKSLVQGFNVDKEFIAPFALPYNKNNLKIEIDSRSPLQSFTKNLLKKYYPSEIIGKNSFIINTNKRENDPELQTMEDLSLSKGLAAFMPNVSYLMVEQSSGKYNYYTLTSNRYFKSKNKLVILGDFDKYEESKRVYKKDTLEVFKGIMVNYPEKIYLIKSNQLHPFITSMHKINSKDTFLNFNKKFGLNQKASNFWKVIDNVNAEFISKNPISGGILDLHRYGSVE